MCVRPYPLFVRHTEFWNCKQKPEQKYSEAFALCRRIGDECDITTMTGEKVICTNMIMLCTDEELKAELMKPEIPTIPGLMQIVHQYERSQAGKQALQQAQQANAVGPHGGGRNNKGNDQQLANSTQNGKCKGCVGTHNREKCPHKESTCHACGVKAHIKAVCRASEEKHKAYANKGKREKPQGTNAAAHQESEGEDESAQALCTTPTLNTVAVVSPYLSYVQIIFDAKQPGSRPMHIYSVLDTGASVTIMHACFASRYNVCHNNKESVCKAAGKAVLVCNG